MEEYNTMTTKGSMEYRSYSVNGNYSSYGLSSAYKEFHRTAYLTADQLAACSTISEGGYMGARMPDIIEAAVQDTIMMV